MPRVLVPMAAFVLVCGCWGGGDAPSTSAPSAAPAPAPSPTPTPVLASAPSPPTALPASAPSPPAALPTDLCGADTYVQPAWPGEYPSPVVQITAEVTVEAHGSPCDAVSTKRCTLAEGLYHPWAGRGELGFVNLSPVRRLKVLTDTTLETGDGQVPLKAGQTLSVLAYHGEGWAEVRIAGRTLSAFDPGGPAFEEVAGAKGRPRQRQFFSAVCMEGTRAWVEVGPALFARVAAMAGQTVGYGEISVSPVPAFEPGWVVGLGARPSASEADALARELARQGLDATHLLWIPDYGSLSDAKQWLVYLGPFVLGDASGARAALAQARAVVPDAYGIKLDEAGPRVMLEEGP